MTSYPACLARQSRRAFTIVELLVVIAIIGMLVAILLPAVQGAREAARRNTCLQHIRQLAAGVLNYEQKYAVFPPGEIQRTACPTAKSN